MAEAHNLYRDSEHPTTPLGGRLRLPEITLERLEDLSRLARRRQPFETKIGDHDLHIRHVTIPDGAVIEGDDRLDITLALDGRPGTFRVPVSLVNRILETIEPGLSINALDEETTAWALEMALAPALEVLEDKAGVGVQFLGVSFVARPLAAKGFTAFSCQFAGVGSHMAFLKLDRRDQKLLTEFILAQPFDPLDYGKPTIDLSFQVGSTTLTTEELQTLAAGDTVLLDQSGVAKGYVNIAVGAHWRLVARLNNTGGIVVQNALSSANEVDDRLGEREPRSKMAEDEAQNPDEAQADTGQREPGEAPTVPEASVDELPVKLVFELGRLEMELKELRTLSDGYVFNLGRSLTHPVDIIVSGRRIGAGELVRVGESVGVRISRLFANDGAAS